MYVFQPLFLRVAEIISIQEHLIHLAPGRIHSASSKCQEPLLLREITYFRTGWRIQHEVEAWYFALNLSKYLYGMLWGSLEFFSGEK